MILSKAQQVNLTAGIAVEFRLDVAAGGTIMTWYTEDATERLYSTQGRSLSESNAMGVVQPPSKEPESSSGGTPPSAGIVRAAGINSLGNVASRILGLVREAVVAGTFGASGSTSAFDAVSSVPKMVYELLVGGMLSAALVPVLSEYAASERQDELQRVLSILLSLGSAVLLVVVVVLELGARWVAPLLVGGFDAQLLATATLLVRLIVPSIIIYGLSGIIQAYHYARKRFIYPSMGAPAHNLGLILVVLLLARRFDIASLSLAVREQVAARGLRTMVAASQTDDYVGYVHLPPEYQRLDTKDKAALWMGVYENGMAFGGRGMGLALLQAFEEAFARV